MSRPRFSQLYDAARSVDALHRLFDTIGKHQGAWNPDQAPSIVPEGPELSSLETIALLRMVRGDRLARAVAQTLQSELQDTPSYCEYFNLRQRGYAQKDADGIYHVITGLGRAVANRLTLQQCKALRIHELRGGESAIGHNTLYYCTGCEWRTFLHRGTNTYANAVRQFHRHLPLVADAPGVSG